MSILHNENSRVKIPALVHLTRLGYDYVPIKNYTGKIDEDTNIFIDIFRQNINRINRTSLAEDDVRKIIEELKIILKSDDLGRAFYSVLLNGYKGLKLIDFSTANGVGNTFQVVTELTYKNGSDEFRPDITILINGMPLAFIEVKKPNNKEGIQAEYTRINTRCQNEKFRRFVNITQLMVFSNNSEYDDTEIVPLEGAFYAASSYGKLFFSYFREEDEHILNRVSTIDEYKEKAILTDTNLVAIKGSPEYITNSNPLSSTNRIITSLFSYERIILLLRYAVAYVEKTNDNGITTLEKHLMRYPQIFATKAIEKKLNSGVKHGIIWHTQGSGKTALAYYNVRYLKDYYQKQGIIAKFYFIVDRLDLATQAADEFRARGLNVEEINRKEDFVPNIRAVSTTNTTGKDTITVVNIQKFSEESVAKIADYNVNVQRIYFLDEAHRSYKPTGSFLSNLIASDRNAVMIALTGTPLIGTIYDAEGKPVAGKKYDSKAVFGSYIHKYYYNRSIADRYTLRLIREGIATTYRQKLQAALAEIETVKGSIAKKDLYAHPKYVSELVKYIVGDFARSRIALGDDSIGGMIVCDTSEQAKAIFTEIQKHPFTSALILHDVDDAKTRRERRDAFKKGIIDFLIVFNMLLTGFDAARLKKLYLGRIIKDHSLLQALTRVNRPYKKFRYGFVVDFADIRKEFDKTNKAYFDELQAELGDEFKQYDNIFKSVEEIENDLQVIKEKLFLYDTTNAEVFSQQISAMDDKDELINLRQALEMYKELFNISKLFGYVDLSDQFDLEKIGALYTEVTNRINIINLKKTLQDAEDMSAILNLALDQIEFQFKKVSEHELIIADKFRDTLERARLEMSRILDPHDPEYISLLDELKRILNKKNIEELTAEEMTENIRELDRIRKAAEQKNLADRMLCGKYENDPKFMRMHKRLKETPPPIGTDPIIHRVLLGLKREIDRRVLSNEHLLDNEPFFTRDLLPLIRQAYKDNGLAFNAGQIQNISTIISNEYFSERKWAS
jgi:type I restriction enzyme R subunit